MYCLYNNLQFTNLANYDPTTYFLLLQFRVVVTGVVFQVISTVKLCWNYADFMQNVYFLNFFFKEIKKEEGMNEITV